MWTDVVNLGGKGILKQPKRSVWREKSLAMQHGDIMTPVRLLCDRQAVIAWVVFTSILPGNTIPGQHPGTVHSSIADSVHRLIGVYTVYIVQTYIRRR